ncbi:MAG: hypothetical protein PSX80_12195 [bacterium]|nr:hypothetical protein [bacterium]
MQTTKTSQLITSRPVSNLRRASWACALALSGVVGVGAGVAGLLLSFLAAEDLVEPGSSVRLAVPMLIVLSLTSFMGFAHAMDRLQDTRDPN